MNPEVPPPVPVGPPRSRDGRAGAWAVGLVAALFGAPPLAGFIDGWWRPPTGWEHGASRWLAAAAEGLMGHVIVCIEPRVALIALAVGLPIMALVAAAARQRWPS